MSSTNYEKNSKTIPATIAQLVAAYRTGELSVRDFLTAQVERIRTDTHRAWISVISDDDLAAYLDKLEQQDSATLPLYGVPFAIKDNIDLAELPTTAGCPAFAYQPEESAFVVQALIKAGAIPLGKTNLDQFATGLVGTRSPWGAAKNSFIPEYISGGSSSGSAVSVATGQVYFSLGTDTAGSGRVPAGFNNLYGLKATKGLLSCSGVVPACRSLDCVTLFAKTAADIRLLYSVAASYDAKDAFARPARKDLTSLTVKPLTAEPLDESLSSANTPSSFKGVRVGVPAMSQLAFFGNTAYQELFEQTTQKLAALGAELVPFDLQPFINAATLLYQGPWVAERYAAIEAFYDAHADDCLPVIQQITGAAKTLTAVETFKGMYQLQDYKVDCDKALEQVDVVLTPTAGTIYTIDEVNADPIKRNSDLGFYTNFMNLLDYCAIAIPAGFTDKGLPFGVTLFAPAFDDAILLDLAQRWQLANPLPLGATGQYDASYATDEKVDHKAHDKVHNQTHDQIHGKARHKTHDKTMIDLLVCGAHMQGLPLNHQLLELGGSFKETRKTAPAYQLFQLAGGPPKRPGLVRDLTQGQAIEVEIWRMPIAQLGTFLQQIPHPLGLGQIELDDQEWVMGFICEPVGMAGATDISQFGGWRHFLASELADELIETVD
ncbi:allophanate hydrolase [Marinomonas agarivorans]|nr:allophanate hydrolase [Marinomonas agarivorans]